MPVATDAFVEARSISEVLDRLDAATEASLTSGSRNAFFTCLYRRVTQQVADDIAAGRFEDGPRMERLDVVFANRYLAALHASLRREPTTASWRVAFDAAGSGDLIVLQHLLLGMNAHINLDLGIAAAQVAPGASIDALRGDFDEISVLLGEMLDDVQDRLTRISPWLGLLDLVGGRSDEEICTFCLGGARDLAWKWARTFALGPRETFDVQLAGLDRIVALMAVPIRRPTPLVSMGLRLVRARESRDLLRIVEALR